MEQDEDMTEASGQVTPVVVKESTPSSKSLAPVQTLPRTDLIHIEYPGIIRPSSKAAAQGDASSSSLSSLDRALVTLAPHPPPHGSVASSLDNLGYLISLEHKGIECRPGAAALLNRSEDLKHRASTEIYRHPIVGELAETRNLVVVLRRRVWRRKKKPVNGESNGIHDSSQNRPDEIKEYTADGLGVVHKTARWRKMADFAFEPDLDGPSHWEKREEQRGIIDVPADVVESNSAATADANAMDLDDPPAPSTERGGILALHDALARMDAKALQSFSLPEETEEYEIPSIDPVSGETTSVSNARMLPPALFTKVDLPFHYNFRQTPGSTLKEYHRVIPGGGMMPSTRYVNTRKAKHVTPRQWSFLESKVDVPKKPSGAAQDCKADCDKDLLERLTDKFNERPVWTRLAILSSFEKADERRKLNFNKEYFALVAYTITDGPWRECLVRLGYDVRDDPEARFYQRLTFQIPGSESVTRTAGTRGPYKKASSSTAQRDQSRSSKPGSFSPPAGEGSSPERAMDVDAMPEGPSSVFNVDDRQSWKFDGNHVGRIVATFQLVDITDTLARPHIESQGEGEILPFAQGESGWYCKDTWDRIKAVVHCRFRHLHIHETPASEEAVLKTLTERTERLEGIARRERMATAAPTEATSDGDDGSPKPVKRGRGRPRKNPEGDAGSPSADRGAGSSRGQGSRSPGSDGDQESASAGSSNEGRRQGTSPSRGRPRGGSSGGSPRSRTSASPRAPSPYYQSTTFSPVGSKRDPRPSSPKSARRAPPAIRPVGTGSGKGGGTEQQRAQQNRASGSGSNRQGSSPSSPPAGSDHSS